MEKRNSIIVMAVWLFLMSLIGCGKASDGVDNREAGATTKTVKVKIALSQRTANAAVQNSSAKLKGGSLPATDDISEAKKRANDIYVSFSVAMTDNDGWPYEEERYSAHFPAVDGEPLNPLEMLVEPGTYIVRVSSNATNTISNLGRNLFSAKLDEVQVTEDGENRVVVHMMLNKFIFVPVEVSGLAGDYVAYGPDNWVQYCTSTTSVAIDGVGTGSGDCGSTMSQDDGKFRYNLLITLAPATASVSYMVVDRNGKKFSQTIQRGAMSILDEFLTNGFLSVQYLSNPSGFGIEYGQKISLDRLVSTTDLGNGQIEYDFDGPLSNDYVVVVLEYDDGVNQAVAYGRLYAATKSTVVNWIGGAPKGYADKSCLTLTVY